jgi:hypothetical protein
LEGAQKYAAQATKAFKDGPYEFVSTEIPTDAITDPMSVTVDRGIDTVVVSTEDLEKLAPPQQAPPPPE